MVGRLTNLPMTFVGALALGLIQELTNVTWLWPEGDVFLRLRLAVPGIFLVLAVLFVPSFRLSAGRVVGRDEPRVPTIARAAIAGVVLVAVVAIIGQVGSGDVQATVLQAMVTATVALSLVALTGLSGQVSLAQFLFVGVGAFVTGNYFGGNSVLGMLAGGVVAAITAVLVALPAVRLRGLHLALSTFGLALVGREVVLGDARVFGLSGISVGRPEIFGISTATDAAFATWCAIVFSVLSVLVVAVRRSWFGRQLTAIRDSELAAGTLGLKVRQAKILVFALSGFIAGCSGALLGGRSGAVQGTTFDPVESLVILLFAFVGGITSITGALLAGTVFALLTYTQSTFAELGGVVFIGVGAAAVGLGRQPNGLAGVALDVIGRLRRPAAPARGAASPPPTAADAAPGATPVLAATGAEA
jgi:branched-chain amino acid transport system permease protein